MFSSLGKKDIIFSGKKSTISSASFSILVSSLPHDRAFLLTVKNEWYASCVTSFFARELEADGDDITTNLLFFEHTLARAQILAKEDGIFSGREEAEYFFHSFFPDIAVQFSKKDGEGFQKGEIVLTLQGDFHMLLKIERVLLNFLMRVCGIAMLTKTLAQKAAPVAIAATRKTLWGALDKKAVAVGGGYTHRIGLFDAVLVKENHLALWKGNLEALFQKVREDSAGQSPAFFELEIETEEMFDEALRASERISLDIPVVIMFDNFSPEKIVSCMKRVPTKRTFFFEASGGIRAENIAEYAKTGVDILSIGALTHTAKPVDLSFQILG